MRKLPSLLPAARVVVQARTSTILDRNAFSIRFRIVAVNPEANFNKTDIGAYPNDEKQLGEIKIVVILNCCLLGP